MGWLVQSVMVTLVMLVLCVIVIPVWISLANRRLDTVIETVVIEHFRDQHRSARVLKIRRLPPLRRFFQADKRVLWVLVSVDRSSPYWVSVRREIFAAPMVSEC